MGSDPFQHLYNSIASRKREDQATDPYEGGNGRIDRAARLIRMSPLPKGGTLLDIGGATGNLGWSLRDIFSRRIVLDITPHCEAGAKAKGSEFICHNVDQLGLQGVDDCSVDLITMLDVIEHVIDPESLARECFRVLKDGGAVLVNTPNIQYWRHLHQLVVAGIFPHTSGDPEVYHGGHVAFFNRRDMEKIFSAAGFVDPTMHFDELHMDPPPPLWTSISSVQASEMSVSDLIFSCRKFS